MSGLKEKRAEREREREERRGPCCSGSFSIIVNGTNYKSKAISPHYSTGTQ